MCLDSGWLQGALMRQPADLDSSHLLVLLISLMPALASCTRPAADGAKPGVSNQAHLGSFAWTMQQWQARCKGVRTTYNPESDLSDATLTLVPGDPRWLDFVYWAINNK